ncbi:hypothetical protein GQ457_07G031480 [Hibiscus cannabinus]
MADALVSAVLQQLTAIVYQDIERKVTLVVDVRKEAQKLKTTLHAIQAVLIDAERRQVKEESVKLWLEKLKATSYDMDDLIDEWNTFILKFRVSNKVCFCVPSSSFCFSKIVLHRDFAVKIKDLNKRLQVIAVEKDMFSFNLNTSKGESERPVTTSFIDVSEIYGRDQDKNAIIRMLLSENSEQQSLHIISVVGMGGIGKTTLAQLAYNDQEVRAFFEKRIWVCVSDPFDEIRVAKAILEALTGVAPSVAEFESLLQKIHRSVQRKKFLLVLDDVWTEDCTKWESLKLSLKCGTTGSKVLITTRKENVANIMGSTTLFPLGQLYEEECWSMFSRVAFFGRTSDDCKGLEDIGRKISHKCKGLPLAAKVLGGLLRFKKSKEQWQSVLDSELWELEEVEKGIFPPLLLSYYDLPSTLRQCFSYCALFLKDSVIEKDKLIKLWMAQGFFKGMPHKEMEIIGQECFDDLAMRSFFQDFQKDESNNSIVKCKMHDIVHDFAQFLTKNECFVLAMEVEKHSTKTESYNGNYFRHLVIVLEKESPFPSRIHNVPKLRSLLIKSYNKNSSIGGALPKLFDQLICLRTLDLSWCLIKEIPKEIGKLTNLRYLKLSNNHDLLELPETLCDLYNLQTLDLTRCRSLLKLPSGIGKLQNLRHLDNWETFGLRSMPKGMQRLTCLRTLKEVVVSNGDRAFTLADLSNLSCLRGDLKIRGLGNAADVTEARKAKLHTKKDLVGLTLNFDFSTGRMRDEDVILEALQPPCNVERLDIRCFNGPVLFPSWLNSSTLPLLKHVTIGNCRNWILLPPLGELPSLESLQIINMTKVKKVGSEFLGLAKEERQAFSPSPMIAFPSLKSLRFSNMVEWKHWINYEIPSTRVAEVENVIMPRLQSLELQECHRLKALPHFLLGLTSLKELSIVRCPNLSEYCRKELPHISHIPNIRIDGVYVRRSSH